MRTVDPILAAAIAGGAIPYTVYAYGYLSDGNESGESGEVLSFKLGRLGGTITMRGRFTENTLYCKIQKIVRVANNGYIVPSAEHWYISSERSNAKTEISTLTVNPFDTLTYFNSTSSDQPVSDCLTDLMSSQSSASFITQPWNTYQFRPNGTTLTPQKFEGVLGLLWNQYNVKMFPRDNGVCLFRNAGGTYNMERNWTVDDFRMIDRLVIQNFNPFWFDETGASHRLSAFPGYSTYANYKIRNINFLPSTVNPDDIDAIYFEARNYNTLEHTIRPDFEIENGDVISVSGTGALCIANVIESYNMPGTPYPWQMTIKGEKMSYGY